MGYRSSDDSLVCDICGSSVDGPASLAVTVARLTDDSRGAVGAVFCGQPHAATWLASPLPDPAPLSVEPRSRRDRAAEAGLWAVIAVVAGLSLAGVLALAQWTGIV